MRKSDKSRKFLVVQEK
uniref:Uncharacterized protein n=1 Tax=Romanomermis culicivorax TaxID=13658 RepID=A0A915JIF8_ROMCU